MQQTNSNTKLQRLISLFGANESASEFSFGGRTASELAERFDTPFYLYSGDVICRQIERLGGALGPDTDIFYSLKANPSLGVSQLISTQGVGAEVASIGELVLAREAGFQPDNIIFAGPGKTQDELDSAASMGIYAVNVESVGELRRFAEIAGRSEKAMGVGIRINPALQVKGSQMRMGGGPLQFGIDEDALEAVISDFKHNPWLRIRGPHVYVGTQIFDPDALAGHFNHVVDLALTIADGTNETIDMIDFGGGFGVPYFEGTSEFDLEHFGDLYRGVVGRCKNNSRLKDARLVVELGRYLMAESGMYVTRVVDVKASRGRRFVVTDGGMNHHITATGNFGQVFRKPYPVALLNRLDAPVAEETTLVGPCCTPLDVIAKDVPFPDVEVGDLIGIFYSGAYGYSASSLAFLSHPTPAEIMLLGDDVHELRPAGRAEAVLDNQHRLQL